MGKLPVYHDFTGKVVVITGAGGLICGEMARSFAEAGAKVAAVNRSVEKIQQMEKEYTEKGLCLRAYQADVTNPDDLNRIHEAIKAELGPCDILINGAGGNNPRATSDNEHHHDAESMENCKTFFDLDPSGVDYVFRLNFQGTLLPTQVFTQDMVERKSGCILNISSVAAYNPLTKVGTYAAAKAAISNFTKWLATHFAGTGIRCNAIAPGFLVAKQNYSLLFDEEGNPTPRSQKILNGTPIERFVSAEELIGGTFFLCDDNAAGAVTGVILPIDGGFTSYSGV